MNTAAAVLDDAADYWEDLVPDEDFEVIGFLDGNPGTWSVSEILRLVAKRLEQTSYANQNRLRPFEGLLAEAQK